MQYLIMILIIVGLSISDVLTGIIRAHVRNDYCSKVMKSGLWNKLGEWLVMATVCGLEIGIEQLGRYYQSPALAEITGAVMAGFIFLYIMLMEIISIFENYADMNPDAQWAKKLISKLRNFGEKE